MNIKQLNITKILVLSTITIVILFIGAYFLLSRQNIIISNVPTINPTIMKLPNMILYYPFNGDAKDLSGNGNDGKVQGATLTIDRFGKMNSAYYFDGIDDSISFDTTKMPIGASARTISAWIKAESFPAAPKNYEGIGSRATIIGWGIDNNVGKLSEMQIYNNKLLYDAYNMGSLSKETVGLNQWYHLVIVYKDGKIDMYNNGKKEEFNTGQIDTVPGKGRIGAFCDPTSPSLEFPNGYDLSYFHGVIDDIFVFGEALSDEQVMSLYNDGGSYKP